MPFARDAAGRAAAATRRVLGRTTARLALVAWLTSWLITAAVIFSLYDFTLEALTDDIVQEIDADIARRLDAWPRQLPTHAGVTLWLYRQFAMETADLQGCVALFEADGELQLTNFRTGETPLFRRGDFYTVRYTGHRFRSVPVGKDQPTESFDTCLVREQPIEDGGLLIYGLPFDAYLAPIERLRQIRFWGLLLTATFSLLVAIFMSRRFLQDLRAIVRACDQVAQGDLHARLPVRGNGDDIDHIAVVVNRMLDQIEQLMSGVRDVSDAIAHDLKTPLARLRGQLELLLNLPERTDEAIETVIAEADQMLAAFNALLRIAQLEQGTRRQAFIQFRTGPLLEQLRELFELVFEEKQIRLEVSLPEPDIELYGDRDLWLQALSNLLDNAYKYTPPGGTVRLAAVRDGDSALLIVHDSGPGVPEGELQNVLQRFYRLERHRSSRGTGLGLALVAAICKAHRAELTLANEQGLKVAIRLPLPA